MIDSAEDVVILRALFASSTDVTAVMREALDFCKSKYGAQGVERLYELPFEKETDEFKEWVQTVLLSEPPPDSIEAFYFGLFDSVGNDRAVRPCLYISGSEVFDENDRSQDWACAPAYFPKRRYVISEVLTTLEQTARSSKEHEIELSYFLQLGFAGAAVSHVMQGLPRSLTLGNRISRGLAVSFDEGDLFLLPTIKR
jgi:hypothetical protein